MHCYLRFKYSCIFTQQVTTILSCYSFTLVYYSQLTVHNFVPKHLVRGNGGCLMQFSFKLADSWYLIGLGVIFINFKQPLLQMEFEQEDVLFDWILSTGVNESTRIWTFDAGEKYQNFIINLKNEMFGEESAVIVERVIHQQLKSRIRQLIQLISDRAWTCWTSCHDSISIQFLLTDSCRPRHRVIVVKRVVSGCTCWDFAKGLSNFRVPET